MSFKDSVAHCEPVELVSTGDLASSNRGPLADWAQCGAMSQHPNVLLPDSDGTALQERLADSPTEAQHHVWVVQDRPFINTELSHARYLNRSRCLNGSNADAPNSPAPCENPIWVVWGPASEAPSGRVSYLFTVYLIFIETQRCKNQ